MTELWNEYLTYFQAKKIENWETYRIDADKMIQNDLKNIIQGKNKLRNGMVEVEQHFGKYFDISRHGRVRRARRKLLEEIEDNKYVDSVMARKAKLSVEKSAIAFENACDEIKDNRIDDSMEEARRTKNTAFDPREIVKPKLEPIKVPEEKILTSFTQDNEYAHLGNNDFQKQLLKESQIKGAAIQKYILGRIDLYKDSIIYTASKNAIRSEDIDFLAELNKNREENLRLDAEKEAIQNIVDIKKDNELNSKLGCDLKYLADELKRKRIINSVFELYNKAMQDRQLRETKELKRREEEMKKLKLHEKLLLRP
ncbi:MAG: hypothetical protein MHMPM18_004740, partial [Marteilia pararefringens]